MIDRQLIHSRTARNVFGVLVWAAVATWGTYFYWQASSATEVQLAREAARSEGLEAIMADDHYGVITVGRDGRVIDWNPGVENLSNIAESDALGKDVADLVCGELTAKLERSFREREAGEGKVLVENCDMIGSAVKVRCRIYSARSKQTGDILGVVLVDPQANVTGESLTSQPTR